VLASASICMSTALAQFAQPFDFSWLQQVVVVDGAISRLLIACLLGSLVGLEREPSEGRRRTHKSADLHGQRVLHAAFACWPATPSR